MIQIHCRSDMTDLHYKWDSLKSNEEEMKKCQESPLYFYNTYVLKEGQPPLTEEQYLLHVKMVELQRNAIPIRMRRGDYVFMKPDEGYVKLPEYMKSKD
jgi:hypothetical protein